MSSYDETASPDRDPLSPAPEEAPDTVQETAPEAAGMPQEASADTGKEVPAEPAQDTSVPQESQRKKPSSPYENSPYSGYMIHIPSPSQRPQSTAGRSRHAPPVRARESALPALPLRHWCFSAAVP